MEGKYSQNQEGGDRNDKLKGCSDNHWFCIGWVREISLEQGWVVYSVSWANSLEELLLMPLKATKFIDTCFGENQSPKLKLEFYVFNGEIGITGGRDLA
mgnify:CR=1 FL=1